MPKPLLPIRKPASAPHRQCERRIPPNLPQRQHHTNPLQQLPLPIQIPRTIRNLASLRLIPRRRTPHRRPNINPAQLQPIPARTDPA